MQSIPDPVRNALLLFKNKEVQSNLPLSCWYYPSAAIAAIGVLSHMGIDVAYSIAYSRYALGIFI